MNRFLLPEYLFIIMYRVLDRVNEKKSTEISTPMALFFHNSKMAPTGPEDRLFYFPAKLTSCRMASQVIDAEKEPAAMGRFRMGSFFVFSISCVRGSAGLIGLFLLRALFRLGLSFVSFRLFLFFSSIFLLFCTFVFRSLLCGYLLIQISFLKGGKGLIEVLKWIHG